MKNGLWKSLVALAVTGVTVYVVGYYVGKGWTRSTAGEKLV